MVVKNILDTTAKRKSLHPRSEPYWQKITKGRFIGFRRNAASGTWVARLGKKQRRLGPEEQFTYSAALQAANEWFDDINLIGFSRYTVRHAVQDYIEDIYLRNDPLSSSQIEARLRKHIPETLNDTLLADLRSSDVSGWHRSLVPRHDDPERLRKAKSSANRVLTFFRAALNLAYRNQRVASDQAWRTVRKFQNVEAARTLFLTDEQVQRLLDHTDGPFHDLVEAAVLTGARYGELRAANVEDFDPDQGLVRFDGKTGARECYLSDAGVGFFRRMAKGKLPKAPMLTGPRGDRWQRGHHTYRLEEAKRQARLPADTVFYSLRHYHISKALLAGVNILVVAKNVGTSVKMIEKFYGKFTAANKREMFNQVELGQ